MSLKSEIGKESYDRMRQTIRDHSPGSRDPTDDEVDAIIGWMRSEYDDDFLELGITKPAQTQSPLVATATADSAIYFVKAKHERQGPGAHAFVGQVPMARVSLPHQPDKLEVKTKVGTVLGKDHRLPSCEAVHDQYEDSIDYVPGRVDLIAPARLGGALFGAIAVYLGYQNANDAKPSFFIVEAGTALGDSVRLFPGWNFDDEVVGTSFYRPTPFAQVTNKYKARLYMKDDPNEPRQLHIQVVGSYDVQISADFERTDFKREPAGIILEALVRVATIARAMGQRPFGPVTDILAKIGAKRTWIDAPGA